MEDPKTLFIDNQEIKTLINQTVDQTISPLLDIPKDEGLTMYVFDYSITSPMNPGPNSCWCYIPRSKTPYFLS